MYRSESAVPNSAATNSAKSSDVRLVRVLSVFESTPNKKALGLFIHHPTASVGPGKLPPLALMILSRGVFKSV